MNVAKSDLLTSHKERLCKRTKINISDFLIKFFININFYLNYAFILERIKYAHAMYKTCSTSYPSSCGTVSGGKFDVAH